MLREELFFETLRFREAKVALLGIVCFTGGDPKTFAALQVERFFQLGRQIWMIDDLIEVGQGLLAIPPLLQRAEEFDERLVCRARRGGGQNAKAAAEQPSGIRPHRFSSRR